MDPVHLVHRRRVAIVKWLRPLRFCSEISGTERALTILFSTLHVPRTAGCNAPPRLTRRRRGRTGTVQNSGTEKIVRSSVLSSHPGRATDALQRQMVQNRNFFDRLINLPKSRWRPSPRYRTVSRTHTNHQQRVRRPRTSPRGSAETQMSVSANCGRYPW